MSLVRDLERRVQALTRISLRHGDFLSVRRQVGGARGTLRAIDAAAEQVFARDSGEASIAARVLRGEAHEFMAILEGRALELVLPSREEALAQRRAEQAVARLERLAGRLERARSPQAAVLRERAAQIREQLDPPWVHIDRRPPGLIFDEEAQAERLRAIADYAAAVQAARVGYFASPYAWRALERLHQEENSARVEEAARRHGAFSYVPGMFREGTPGITLMQPVPVFAPGLVLR